MIISSRIKGHFLKCPFFIILELRVRTPHSPIQNSKIWHWYLVYGIQYLASGIVVSKIEPFIKFKV